jgi:hypothetical protein
VAPALSLGATVLRIISSSKQLSSGDESSMIQKAKITGSVPSWQLHNRIYIWSCLTPPSHWCWPPPKTVPAPRATLNPRSKTNLVDYLLPVIPWTKLSCLPQDAIKGPQLWTIILACMILSQGYLTSKIASPYCGLSRNPTTKHPTENKKFWLCIQRLNVFATSRK